MIIQSPELLLYKKDDATKRIDKYLLVLTTFKNGLAFGVKFNKRQNKPGQWLMQINGTCMLGGIGDLRDFQAVTLFLSDFCQQTANMIGGHYLTGAGIVNFLAEFLSKNFEEKAKAMAVNFIVADWHNKETDLWFIDFDGRIKQLKNFAVAGGSEYEEQLSKEDFEKLPPEAKDLLMKQKIELAKAGIMPENLFAPTIIRNPRKQAIAYLEGTWKPKMKKEEAIELLKNALFECNPESRDRTIEITVIKTDQEEAETFYFQKGNKKIKIK